MTVIWNDLPLKVRTVAAFPIAARDYLALARSRFPNKKVGATLTLTGAGVAYGVTSPHIAARLIEMGAPPHIITPRSGTVLRLADGTFVTGSVSHPGIEARPTLRPLLSVLPALYRRRAMSVLRFRV